MIKVTWHKWIAVSVLIGLALAVLWGMWSMRQQQQLAGEVIRLHVIAASDSAEDQQLKLRVRDVVLDQAEQWLKGADSREEAETILRTHLMDLRNLAEETVNQEGYDYEVEAWLTPEEYPTRDYGTFALPGGEYLSLRVILGEGEGHNWWCVVFPPLCTAAASGTMEQAAAEAGLSEESLGLITQADEGYVLRFKSIELWEKWTGQ